MNNLETKIIQAHKIEIIDEQDNAKIKLYTRDKAPVIELYHFSGKPCLELEVNNEGQAGICLRNPEGKLLAFLGIGDGQPGLGFYSPGGQRVVEIFMDYDRGVIFGLYDMKGEHQLTITFDFLKENEGPVMCIFDREGRNRITLSLIKDTPNINFYDESGRQRFILGFGDRGSIGIWFNDLHEKPQIVIGSDYDGEPRIWLYGEEKEHL